MDEEEKTEEEKKIDRKIMIYIGKAQKAVSFAIRVHEVDQKQKRKGKDAAYISHPLTVGLILSRAVADEDLMIAGILHDTVEDSIRGKKVTAEILREEFGERVVSSAEVGLPRIYKELN